MADLSGHYDVTEEQSRTIFNVTPAQEKLHIGLIVLGSIFFAVVGGIFMESLFGAMFGLFFWGGFLLFVSKLKEKARHPYKVIVTDSGILNRVNKEISKDSISSLKITNQYLKSNYQGATSGVQTLRVNTLVTPGLAGAAVVAASSAMNAVNSSSAAARTAQLNLRIAASFAITAICRGKQEVVADLLSEDTAIALMNEISAHCDSRWNNV